MVIGSNPQVTWSLFAPQYDGGSAQEFAEATRPLPSRAGEIKPLLFIITLIINMISRMFIWSMGARSGHGAVRRTVLQEASDPRSAAACPVAISSCAAVR